MKEFNKCEALTLLKAAHRAATSTVSRLIIPARRLRHDLLTHTGKPDSTKLLGSMKLTLNAQDISPGVIEFQELDFRRISRGW